MPVNPFDHVEKIDALERHIAEMEGRARIHAERIAEAQSLVKQFAWRLRTGWNKSQDEELNARIQRFLDGDDDATKP